MPVRAIAALLVVVATSQAGCSRERRQIDPDQPLTAPTGAADPRISRFQDNAFQIAQGARYFAWYGCNACHGTHPQGSADLAHSRLGLDGLYTAIADHGSLGRRIPSEQLWQLAAYVHRLARFDPSQRQRQDLDQAAEPQAGQWKGPLR